MNGLSPLGGCVSSLSSHEAPINHLFDGHHRFLSPAWWHRRCCNCASRTSGGLVALHVANGGEFLTSILTARLIRLIAVARKNGASSNPTEAPAENTCAVVVVPEVCTQRSICFSGTDGLTDTQAGTCTDVKGATCSSRSLHRCARQFGEQRDLRFVHIII